MDFFTILIYFISAFILFFCLNYFDRAEKENNLIHAVIPIVYELLLAGFFTKLGWSNMNEALFLVVVLELMIRLIYIKSILKREDLMNTSFYVQIYGISILGCYLVNSYFISEVASVFPTAEEMRVGIWLLVFLFLYFVVKKHIHIQYKEQASTFGERKQEYIVIQYTRFKNIYQKEIRLKNKELYSVVYAIMIYENYRRPAFFRKIDTIFYRFTGKQKKFGIMQILSEREIDDIASIKLAVKRIEKIVSELPKKSKKLNVEKLLSVYYEDEYKENQVLEVYQKIMEFNEL